MARLSASVLVASLAMASATQRTYHDITVGGGTWISEVRWSLHCYTSASTSGCTTGCEAPITYSYTTAGGSTSTGTGNSYTGPNGVYIRYGQLSLRTAANWCTLTMLDTANDGWQNNRWRAPSMGVPSAGYTLVQSGGDGPQSFMLPAHPPSPPPGAAPLGVRCGRVDEPLLHGGDLYAVPDHLLDQVRAHPPSIEASRPARPAPPLFPLAPFSSPPPRPILFGRSAIAKTPPVLF